MSLSIVTPAYGDVLTSPFTCAGVSSGDPTDIVDITITDGSTHEIAHSSTSPDAEGNWSQTLFIPGTWLSGTIVQICATLYPGGTAPTTDYGPQTFTPQTAKASINEGYVPVPPGAETMSIYAGISSPLAFPIYVEWLVHSLDNPLALQVFGRAIPAGLTTTGNALNVVLSSQADYVNYYVYLGDTTVFCTGAIPPPGCLNNITIDNIVIGFDQVVRSLGSMCVSNAYNTQPVAPPPPPPIPPPGGGPPVPGSDCCAQTIDLLNQILASIRRDY